MRNLVRLIVMWLIAVALPIQGVAAATMLHCGSTAGQQAAAWTQSHAGHAHHHDVTAQSDGVPEAHHSHHHGGGKLSCSACASCCSAAALPAVQIVLASQTLAETAIVSFRLPLVVFLTDGPERPPRTILA